MQPGQPVVNEIAANFGEEVVSENGEINRKRLGKIVFESDEERAKLNELMQTRIRKKIKEERNNLLKKNKEIVILDIPLLYEENYESLVDEVMVVYVNPDIQKERLMNRDSGLTEEDALNRITSQIPLSEKAQKADSLIDNNGTIENTIKQVDNWLDKSGFSHLLI